MSQHLSANGFATAVCFTLCLFLLPVSATTGAETAPERSSHEALSKETHDILGIYRLARENDPSFQAEQFRFEATTEVVRQARSDLLPSIRAGAYYQHTEQNVYDTEVVVYAEDRVDYPSHGFNLTLNQPLFRYALFQRLSQAKEEVKGAELALEAAKENLVLRVAQTYLEALEAYDNMDFSLAEEDAVQVHFSLAKARFDSGLAPVTDFHDAKARLANTRARRILAETRLEDALEALTELTGREVRTVSRLKYSPAVARPDVAADGSAAEEAWVPQPIQLESPDPDNVNEWIDAAMRQNLEIQVRQQAVRVAEDEVDVQMGGHWPDLALVGRFNRDDEGGSLFGGSSDIGTAEAIVQLNVPIYQGGYVSSKVREARKRRQAAEQDLEREVRGVKRQTKAAFLGVESAIQNIRALRQSVISNLIALEAKREGFASGMFPSLVVLDGERDLAFAKRAYVNAQYGYLLNGLRLKKAVGTLQEEDLTAVNQWLE